MEITAKQQAAGAEIPKDDNETNITEKSEPNKPGKNKTVVWLVERIPPEFKKFLQSNN